MTATHPRLSSLLSRPRAVLLSVLLLTACDAGPVQRPREGAAPISGGTPIRLASIPPPTLAAVSSLSRTATPVELAEASPSPGIGGSPGIAGSPGLAPIVSGLQPAPGASLPAGDVVISARVSGTSDLVDVTAFLNGEAVDLDPVGPSIKVRTVSFVRPLVGGVHEIRIQARDQKGQLGGYRWQFSVGGGRQATGAAATPIPAPPTATLPVRTPPPIPTRRPTVALPALPGASPTTPLRR